MLSRHDLASILFIGLAATLCGAKSCVEMAEFGEAGPREDLGAHGRVVKLGRLDSEVPNLPRVTPEQREAELVDRRAAYLRRLPEGTA